jgi:hypothetical protein
MADQKSRDGKKNVHPRPKGEMIKKSSVAGQRGEAIAVMLNKDQKYRHGSKALDVVIFFRAHTKKRVNPEARYLISRNWKQK